MKYLRIPLIFFILLIINISCFTLNSASNKNAIVLVNNLVFRESPTVKSKKLGKFKTGDIIKIISLNIKQETIASINDYWHEVEYNNRKGYVFGYYIEILNNKIKILHNERFGKVIFLGENFNTKKVITYESFDQAKNNSKKDDFQFSKIKQIDDELIQITKFIGSTTIPDASIINSAIYNYNGNEIYSLNNTIHFQYLKSLKYIIINFETEESKKTLGVTKFTNEILVYNLFGKLIKKIKVDLSTSYKDFGLLSDNVLVSSDEKYYVWIKNSKLIVINTNSLKAKYYNYNLKSIKSKNTMIDISDISERNDIVNFTLIYFDMNDGPPPKEIFNMKFDLEKSKFL